MAEHKHGEMDITTQTKTFEGFISATKWVTIVLLVLLVWMAIFIT